MSALAITAAFMRRDWKIDVSYRIAFAIQAVATIFTLALFFFLGRAVDDSGFAERQGLETDFFGFVAVGLAVFELLRRALPAFAQRLRDEQLTGTFEALMAVPATPSAIILASAAYDFTRALVDALVLLLIAVLVFGLDLQTDPGMIGVAVLVFVASMALLASLGVAIATVTVLVQRAAGLVGVLATVLAFIGGVYFPVEVMPEPLETIAELVPLTWALELLRASLLGGEVDETQLVALLVASAALVPAALWAFHLALRRARRTGKLAQY